MSIIFVIAFLQSKTCELILMHYFSNEHDLAKIIQRVLGDTFYKVYLISSGGLMVLITIGYFLLTCNTFYHVITFLITISNEKDKL